MPLYQNFEISQAFHLNCLADDTMSSIVKDPPISADDINHDLNNILHSRLSFEIHIDDIIMKAKNNIGRPPLAATLIP